MLKALSVIKPYGDMIMSRIKQIEVRSWYPENLPLKDIVLVQNINRLSSTYEEEAGFAVGLIDIEKCRTWDKNDLEKSCCDTYTEGYYAWEISNIRPFKKYIPIIARRKIYEIDRNEENKIRVIQTDNYSNRYWERLRILVENNKICIDRKKGTAHPNYSNIIYPVDYGYIENTTSMDNGGIDIFIGTDEQTGIQGIVCTIDILKNDSEIKIIYNCTENEIEMINEFLESKYMSSMFIKKST